MASSTTPHSNSLLLSSTSTASAAHCTSCLSRGLEINTLKSTLASERTAHTQELEELEIRIRAECWDAFELQQEKERAALAAAREEEQERLERHIDSKVDVLVRGLGVTQDDDESMMSEAGRGDEVRSKELEEMRKKMQAMEKESRLLKEKVKMLEKEKEEKRKREEEVGRTPSRKIKVLKARPWNVDETMGVENEFL